MDSCNSGIRVDPCYLMNHDKDKSEHLVSVDRLPLRPLLSDLSLITPYYKNDASQLSFADVAKSLQLPSPLSTPVSLGTTIMACLYQGGVLVGADSRTTTGAYIANRVTDKLTPLYPPYIYCCRSGSAADTQAIADAVRYYLNLQSMEMGVPVTVNQAAQLVRQMCVEYREQLMASMIVAGWDSVLKEGEIYCIPLGGSMHEKQPYAIGGSGSTYIYGHCDRHWKSNMTKQEAELFVTESIALAMARDGSSGGVIRLAFITADGVERKVVKGEHLPTYWASSDK